jgi:hypothetical protein
MKIAMADGFGAGAGVVRGSGGPRLCRGRRRAPQPHEGLGRVGNGLVPSKSTRVVAAAWAGGRIYVYTYHQSCTGGEERRSGGRCVLRVYSVYCRACLPLYAALSREYLITAGGLAARGLLDCPVRGSGARWNTAVREGTTAQRRLSAGRQLCPACAATRYYYLGRGYSKIWHRDAVRFPAHRVAMIRPRCNAPDHPLPRPAALVMGL